MTRSQSSCHGINLICMISGKYNFQIDNLLIFKNYFLYVGQIGELEGTNIQKTSKIADLQKEISRLKDRLSWLESERKTLESEKDSLSEEKLSQLRSLEQVCNEILPYIYFWNSP